MVELIVSVAIFAIIAAVVGRFAGDIFSLNMTMRGNMNAELDARHVIKTMVSELREASSSNLGAYPIVLASSTTVTFYSDINADGLKEEVRYFLNGGSLMMGVTTPSGNPLAYNSANEKLSTLISGVVASSTQPLFQYYSSAYAGTSSPLTQPVDVSTVNLVKITVVIDEDPNKSPIPMIVTSQVSLRNLKNNQ